MAERKFTRVLSKPGSAAQVRETVSQAVRESSNLSKPHLVEPLDYETFIVKNRNLLQNDPQKDLIQFPEDDICEITVPIEHPTTVSPVPTNNTEGLNLLVQECLKTYTTTLKSIQYKNQPYSGTFLNLPRLSKAANLQDHVYEVDTENDEFCNESLCSNSTNGVTKEGYMFRGPESGTDSFISLATKSFKRRYVTLKPTVDGTYILEFHKDDRKSDSKGTICMDFCHSIMRNSKRGKFSFELRMGDGYKSCVLAAENELELENWITCLNSVINKQDRKSVQSFDCSEIPLPSPSSTSFYGTLKSLEHSKNPELVKYSKETDHSISLARKENRQNIFSIYPDLENTATLMPSENVPSFIDTAKRSQGVQVFLRCEEVKFRLQASLENNNASMCQVEPYITSIAIFDAKRNEKVTEEFRFDANTPYIRNLLPKSNSRKEPGGDSCFLVPVGNNVEEWLAFPRQAIFSLPQPNPDLYLVLRIEKVLQGSISQATDAYLKVNNGDGKLGLKIHKQFRTCSQKIGHYRMPFVWAARPLFKPYTRELDDRSDFGPLYRQEGSKISDEDLLKFLSDFKKPDKLKNLTVIPGQVKLLLKTYKEPIPNVLTPSLIPVNPFPIPPSHEPTLHVQDFLTDVPQDCSPFSSYTNLLYIFPRSLKYDTQKQFNKARNIGCYVELRDSDEEGSLPLKCIFGRPGEGLFTKGACTSVLYHTTLPDFYEEVKFLLPIKLHDKHHLRFTFYHVGCEMNKKKDGPVESLIGTAYFTLLDKGRINTLDQKHLSIASSLPPGYLACQPLGLGKGMSGPDIKWVDGGKELFKFDMKLVSSIYTNDIHLNNFFTHCEKLFELKQQIMSHQDTNIMLKALHAVNISNLIYFLPTLLNQLFRLLVAAPNEETSLNIVRILIHIVQSMHEVGKGASLVHYVQNILDSELLSKNSETTIYEELTKSLTMTLRPANTDFLVINKFLRHSGFFFNILIKSMAQHLMTSNKIQLPRHERFSSDFQYRVQSLIQGILPHIHHKYKDLPKDTRFANQSLAHFIKRCFTFMDRGFVFKLNNLYLDKFNPGDPQTLQEYKFEFLQVICSHEHFISLNLPYLRGTINKRYTKNITDYEHEYRLSDEFCHYHFLVGALLQEVKQGLTEIQEVRQQAILVLRDLLAKHAFDDRFQTKAHQARIASLYLPFISIVLDNVNRLQATEGTPSPPTPLAASVLNTSTATLVAEHTSSLKPSNSTKNNRDSTYLAIIAGQVDLQHQNAYLTTGSSGSLDSTNSTPSFVSEKSGSYFGHNRSQSLPFTTSIRYDKLDYTEIKDLLLCFLYVVKHVNEELLIGWWQHCTETDTLDYFYIFELCLHHFKYLGKRRIRISLSSSTKAMTLPARILPPSFTDSDINSSFGGGSEAGGDSFYRALLEANMATEVGLITLDVLGLYTVHFKAQLLHNDGDNLLMRKVFDIYLSFLQVGQSETLLKHLFAALRAFINKFPEALFQGNAILCGKLCFELLRCCNSRLSTVRNEACALVYLLMRSNFDFTLQKSLTRVHLQLIVGVSRLLGDVLGLNTAQFQESLSVINKYASSDEAMQRTVFPNEVKNLTKKIRTVLMATLQMKDHENDPEMLVDLQHKLANSYDTTPALRKTWLESMARHHIKNGNYSEAAHCYIHTAALEAEYLKQKGNYPLGCSAFKKISFNIEQDESNIKGDLSIHDVQYSEDSFLERLELCVSMLEKAERYEVMGDIYKLIIPIYEQRRNFEALADCYKILHSAYAKVIEVGRTGKRLLGRFYRVAFFGQAYFEEENFKEYIYKEPKVTSLVEISERLYRMFCEKFGRDQVKMIMDSNQVNNSDLDPKLAHIQLTHVIPYFDEKELALRPTEFERNNSIRHFMFETPFTIDGSKARGTPEEQCKRRTILKTMNSFPYVKTRIAVFSKTVQRLDPIQVAIDEMQIRVAELQDVVGLQPPDLKKLQLKLQGSICVQVNAGPLAYSKAFLDAKTVAKYPTTDVTELRANFRRFLSICEEALELNARLITSDQYEYHNNLKSNYQELVTVLSPLIQEKWEDWDSNKRNSEANFLNVSVSGSSCA